MKLNLIRAWLMLRFQQFLRWPSRKKRLVIIALIAALIALVILNNLINYFEEEQAERALINAPVAVTTGKVALRVVPEVLTAVGNMQAIKSVDVSFDADAELARIYRKNGERVKKGDIVAALDTRSDEALLDSYKASLAYQKSNYQRMLSIKDSGAISLDQLDSSKAQMLQAEAQVKEQQFTIEEKKWRAPFDGVLTNITDRVGGFLPKGTAIATLVQEAPLVVQYTVPTSYRPAIELGQIVTVTSSTYANKSFKGILSYVAPQVNAASGTMTLQATVDNRDFLLLPGMFVSVSQMLNPDRKLLMLPDVALMTDITGQYVFKVTGTSVQKVYVTTGIISGGYTEIISGLGAGDTVVTAGQQKLKSDDRIDIIPTGS